MAQKESIHSGILEQVQANIRSLITQAKIEGIDSASVRVRKVPVGVGLKVNPMAGEIQLPAIIITPFGRIYPDVGTNVYDEIGYNVGIAVAAADNQNLEDDIGTHVGWLETIEDEFRTVGLEVSALTTPIECHKCVINSALSYNFSMWVANWAVGSTVLTFFHNKQRGNN